MSITAADLQTFSAATLRLYAPDLQTSNWVERAFEFLTSLVSVDMINYGDLDIRSKAMKVATTCDRSDWAVAVTGFGEFMGKYEYFDFNPAVNDGRPFFRSDFISGRQFRDTDIWCECFRLLETMDHAAIHVPTEAGHWVWFSAERGGRANFNNHDRILLTLGQEQLANSYQLAVARKKMREQAPIDASRFVHLSFTPRESEVACWLTEGKTNAEIALILNLGIQTVKAHVTTLFNKTGIGNRLALTLHLMDLACLAAEAPQRSRIFPVRDWPAPTKARRKNP